MTSTTLNQSPVVVQTFMGALYSSQYYAADNGAVNAISIPLAIAPNAYSEGIIWFTKFAQTNTSGTVTAKVGSLAALPVVIDQAGTLPITGSIIQNMFGMLCYSAAQNKLILLNPSDVTGSFTITLTGMSAGTTGSVSYRIGADGKGIDVWVAANILGTSNATTMTGTGVPSVLQASTDHPTSVNAVNSGANLFGCISGLNTGTWVFANGPFGNSSTFTNTGTKGLQVCGFRYTRD